MTFRLGVTHIPTDPTRAAVLARRAEGAGVGWFGIADSPVLYGAMYPAVQHALAATERIRIGTLVTNPMTRHASIHASTCEAVATLYPGRMFFGIGAGDSAVHAAGLSPGHATAVAATVEAVRQRAGDELHIVTAVGGPRAAAAVSPASDGVLIGTGMDADVFGALADAANARAGGPRQRWIYAPSHLVETEDEVDAARAAIRSGVVAFSRHAMSGDPVAKGAPPELADNLREMYGQYDYGDHARLGSRNAALLARYPTEERYLFERFAVVGTPSMAAARLTAFQSAVGEVGAFLGLTVPHPDRHLELIGELVRLLRQENLP